MDWLVEAMLDGELTKDDVQSISHMAQLISIEGGHAKVRAYISANSVRQAVNDGLDRFSVVLSQLATRPVIVGLEAIMESVRLNLPRLPAIVGIAEVQQILNIKHRQQVGQMAARPNFPRPIATLIGGRIWLLSDIEAFKISWRR